MAVAAAAGGSSRGTAAGGSSSSSSNSRGSSRGSSSSTAAGTAAAESAATAAVGDEHLRRDRGELAFRCFLQLTAVDFCNQSIMPEFITIRSADNLSIILQADNCFGAVE